MSARTRGKVTAVLHWAHAGVILGLFALGWFMLGLPKGPDKAELFAAHKSLGLCAAALLLARMAWRLWSRSKSRGGLAATPMLGLHQALLYITLFLTPLFGYLATSFGRHPVRFFSLKLPKLGTPDEALSQFFAICHSTCGWILLALVILHLATAIRLRQHRTTPGPGLGESCRPKRSNAPSGAQ